MSRSTTPGYRYRDGIYVPCDVPEKTTVASRPLGSSAESESNLSAERVVEDATAVRLFLRRKRRVAAAPERPSRREDVVGQDEAIAQVESFLSGRWPCHLLLLGPPGTGKTTVARIALDIARRSKRTPFERDAPFVYVDGTALPDDRYNNIGGLKTHVAESFYSGTRDRNKLLDLHPDTPDIRLGPMARAHLGILFIDEIGELSHENQTLLLTVLEDGFERFNTRASGAWMDDARTPLWMAAFAREGVPASFVLVGATTRSERELDPALRSRCEIVRFRSLDESDRREIARRSAARSPMRFLDAALDRIAQRTASGRDAARRVMLAVASAKRRGGRVVEPRDVPSDAPEPRAGFRS